MKPVLKSAWQVAPALMLSVGLLSGCNNSQAPAKTDATTPETATTTTDTPTKTLKIATESSYKPFSYTDAQGNLVGFEIDLMNALCEDMKVKCEISSQEFEGLIPGIQAKKFDAAIAGMSITPERLKVVNFTEPYFYSGLVFIGKKGDDISLNSDLKGVKVGAQRSTVSSQYLEDKHPTADIKLYDTQENANLDLNSGRIRAMLSDKVTGNEWLGSEAGKDFEVKGDEISTEGDAMGIAVRKDEPLVEQFNTALANIKGNGKYDAIVAKYFGTASTAAANKATPTVTTTTAPATTPEAKADGATTNTAPVTSADATPATAPTAATPAQ